MSSIFARIFGIQTTEQMEARVAPVIHMMLMDGRITDDERMTLAVFMERVGLSHEAGQRLLTKMQSGAEIALPTKLDHKLEVLASAALIMASDGDVAVRELAFLTSLATRMELPPAVLSDVVQQAVAFGQQLHPDVDVQADFQAALLILARIAANS